MLAVVAAVLFIIGAINYPGDLTAQPWFWGMLALAALSLHFAWPWLVTLQHRRAVPPQ